MGKLETNIKLKKKIGWTDEKDEQLKFLYKNNTGNTVAEIMNLTRSQIKNRIYILGIKKESNPGWFRKGNDPYNKGLKQTDYMSPECIEKYERAFNARLAYENNCIAKYDYPDWMCKPSKLPIKGERMIDFAMKYNTTIEEMKACELQVDRALANES